MVESLASRGLKNAQTVDEVDAGALFVRAHGLPVEVFEKAKEKNLEIIDATCPMVTKIHVQAEKLKADGYKIVVIGDPEPSRGQGHAQSRAGCLVHPRVRPTSKRCRARAASASSCSPRGRAKVSPKSSVSSQRSITRCGRSIRFAPTRTIAKTKRSVSPRDVEVMVVVGGKTSANTKHLADLSESHGARAYHIEGPDELQAQWFDGVNVAGLMSGASTPGMAGRSGRGANGGVGRLCLTSLRFPRLSKAPSKNGLPDIGDRERSPICFCATFVMHRTDLRGEESDCVRRW